MADDVQPNPMAGTPLLRAAAIRRWETSALQGQPADALMRKAGAAVAAVCVRDLARVPRGRPVLALIGPGHNGGDALFAAAELATAGHRVAAVLLDPQAPLSAGTTAARQAWSATQSPFLGPEALAGWLAQQPLVIDGLFGIGLSRPLAGRAAQWARAVAAQASWVVAVDVPSGLDADGGSVVGPPGSVAMRADCTVTLLADKPGLHTGAGCDYAGAVSVADLGLNPALLPAPTRSTQAGVPAEQGALITAASCRGAIQRRRRNTHKGEFGELLVIMGSPTMRGAGVLAALGAQSVGTGRIYLGEQAAAALPTGYPEWLQRLVWDASAGGAAALGSADAIVLGCGLGRQSPAHALIAAALAHPAALVLDADALNGLGTVPDWQQALHARHQAQQPTILTPHPLEAARLLQTDVATVQIDRVASACTLAAQTSATVVLKGAGTVIAEPDGQWSMNSSGHPILAVAGTGDVLAGTVGGLLAQGLPAVHAARLGVWLHGAAGERLAAQADLAGGIGLRASELALAIRAQVNQCSIDRP